MLPTIICAALLSFATPALSRPVLPSTGDAFLTKRFIEKRAPQGPKIGGANFPGKMKRR